MQCARTRHTSDTHAITPIQRIPDHRSVRDWDECFRQILGRRCEGVERDSGTAEDEGLEAWRGHCYVRHCGRVCVCVCVGGCAPDAM